MTSRAIGCFVIAGVLAACSASDQGTEWIPAGEESATVATSQDPSVSKPQDERNQRLGAVEHWLYLIDVNLEPETVAMIASSEHDMVVLDFIPSEAENTGFPMADVIDLLHDADHPKIVLAYIDIGQAEDYRTYWQRSWRIGDPDWIVALDPDGWEGNYPVAYWREEWQAIWLGDDGTISQIRDAGFDGVYLDWIEAYDDENVIAAARIDAIDPAGAMADWVAALAATGRDGAPEFLVVGQNAAELAVDRPDYRSVIDAIAQEQVWFDGGADNDPPGDCPLPATDDDLGTPLYVSSLVGGCLRLYEDYPDSTLHVSSAWYLESLIPLHASGMPVFTVDYALDSANVSMALETSRTYGFIPFVGSRALDRFVPVR